MDVALLGLGKSGQALLEELIHNEFVDTIYVFDPNPLPLTSWTIESSKKVQVFQDVFSILHPFDLVVIASPDHLHYVDLMQCIQFGIPTFVEKPYVSSRTELDRITDELKRNPQYQTTCNLVLRSSPLFRQARSEFLKGAFGSQVFIEGKYLYGRWNKVMNGWRGHENYSVILGGLIHLVDLACFLTGNFDYEVSIKTQRITSKEPKYITDFAQVSMSSSATGFCSLTTDFSANVKHRRDISIFGDLANLEVRGEEVDSSPELLGRFDGLSPAPKSKRALLSGFISKLNGVDSSDNTTPNIEEILKVLNICLGKASYNLD